jgi:CubicO group peptidase (beta-lactamase class C family)
MKLEHRSKLRSFFGKAGWLLVMYANIVTATALAAPGDIPVVSASEAGLSEGKLAEIDRFMERQVADKKMAGGIVIVAHVGKIGLFHAYGEMDLEAKKPMQRDTIFRIYSMSKAVTTAAALTLVDAGNVAVDDPVSKFIPRFGDLKVATNAGLRAPKRPMAIRDLMLHTAGLTYGTGPDALKTAYERLKPMESTDLAQMTDKLAQIPLAYDPGTNWSYGVGIDVLGRVIEVVSGQTLDVFLKQTIFEPLNMSDTAFNVPPEKLARFATNYSRSPGGLTIKDAPATSSYSKKVTLFSGGGGLVGTAVDYLRFLTMIQNGGELDGRRIVRPETVALMTTNQLPNEAFPIHFDKDVRDGVGFGFGFSVATGKSKWDPAARVGEYGWGGAASTHYWSSPTDKLIVITLEQIMPYQRDTESGLKKIIYDAIIN